MVDGAPHIDMPPPGALGSLRVSAVNPDTWIGRWQVGPLGLHIAPLRYSRAPFVFDGRRLRGTRCVFSASTISGAVLSRAPRSGGPRGFENGVHLMARIASSGTVFDGPPDGEGVLCVYDAMDPIAESFDVNTLLFTLNVPRPTLGVDQSTMTQLRGSGFALSPLQKRVLQSATVLLTAEESDFVSGPGLVGVDRYLAGVAAMLLRTVVRRRAEDMTGESVRARAEALIYEFSSDPELTPAVVAARLRISIRHLYRAFNGIESPAARIRRRRLERAAEILAASGSSGSGQVERVALECGFVSAEYFSRAFRREFGLSPRAYRAAHRAPP